MRAALGRAMSRQVSFPVSESDIRRWAIAVYYPADPPQQFWDQGYAKNTQYGGIVAPEDFNPFAGRAGEEGELPVNIAPSETGRGKIMLGAPPPPLKFQLRGGNEIDYGVPMRPGDVITSVTRLADY